MYQVAALTIILAIALVALVYSGWHRHFSLTPPGADSQVVNLSWLPFVKSVVPQTEERYLGRMRTIGSHEVTNADLSRLSYENRNIFEDTELRLEQMFELFLRSRISIATYISLARNELASLDEQLHNLDTTSPDAILAFRDIEAQSAEIVRAADAVKWCLAWAQEFRIRAGEGG
mgnify:CR=1 FL=1